MVNVKALLTLLLWCISLPVLAGETLSEIDRGQHVNGLTAVEDVVKRLQAADDRPEAGAGLEQRREYLWLLGNYAAQSQSVDLLTLAQGAADKLTVMAAQERCAPCALDALLIKTQIAFSKKDDDTAARLLADAGEQLGTASPQQQLALHQQRITRYRTKGLFTQGVAEVVPTLELALQLGYTADRVNALNMQSVFNAYLGDYLRAEKLAKEAMTLAESIHYRSGMAEIQLNLGYVYSFSEDPERQLEAYQRGLAIAEDDPNTVITRAVLLSNIADYWLRHKDYRKALDYAAQGEALAAKAGIQQARAYARTNMGVAKAHLGKLEEGVVDIKDAIETSRKFDNLSDVIGITDELAGVYASAGRYKDAYEQLKNIGPLHLEVAKQRRDRAVLELQEKYSAQSREREIERLGDANRIKEAELSAQTWQRRLWAAFAVVLALAAVVLVQWLKRARHVNQRLSSSVAELEVQSSHDPLTGAFNRRQGHLLLRKYSDALRLSPPTARPELGVMLLDVDFFKRVNDTYGHAAGDRVLVELVRRLRGILRSHDAILRWGGEEFLLLLPDVRPQALASLAQKILHAIGDVPMAIDGGQLAITVSAGCVRSPFGAIQEIEDLVQIADLALYQAKAGGRNRAICVVDTLADLVMTDVGQDLKAAEAAEKLRLEDVPGPSHGPIGLVASQ